MPELQAKDNLELANLLYGEYLPTAAAPLIAGIANVAGAANVSFATHDGLGKSMDCACVQPYQGRWIAVCAP